MRTFVVIPAYNEEKTVGQVVGKCRMQNLLPEQARYGAGAEWRIIVVDDGSTDRTADVAREVGAIVLRHPINRGLGAALATGIQGALRSLADIIVTLDGDLQHDPSEIPAVIAPILQGKADVVIGTRFKCKMQNVECKIPWSRRVANGCGNVITWLLFGVWVSDSQSGFRAFSRPAALRLRLRTSTMEVSSEIIRELHRLKLRVFEVPISVRYTPYTLSKGQGFLRGLETLWKLIVLKFFR